VIRVGASARVALAAVALTGIAMRDARAQGLWQRLIHPQPGCVLDKCLNQKAPTPPAPAPAPAPAGTVDSPAPDAGAPVAPQADTRAATRVQPRGASRPGDFDFYVLALSWSPGFCDLVGNGRNSAQCAEGSGLGFVVHGLWPQYESGFPSDCDTRPVSRVALDQASGLFPDEGLARYEWRKHGTCSGKSPLDYFADVRHARARVTIPTEYQAPDTEIETSPLDIARAFLAANSGLRLEAMAIGCRRGELEEVRVCLEKDTRTFRACPEVARDTCRTPRIKVPAVR
jgi:ribonuclease T2